MVGWLAAFSKVCGRCLDFPVFSSWAIPDACAVNNVRQMSRAFERPRDIRRRSTDLVRVTGLDLYSARASPGGHRLLF